MRVPEVQHWYPEASPNPNPKNNECLTRIPSVHHSALRLELESQETGLLLLHADLWGQELPN